MLYKFALLFAALIGTHSILCATLPVNEDEQKNNSDSRIAGGTHVPIDRAPWQLSVQTRFHPLRHVCGASLISPSRALTAARCFNMYAQPGGFAIVGGTTTLQPEDGFRTPLERFIRHPRYNVWGGQNNFVNDLAVLWLQYPAPNLPTVRAIPLPAQNAPVPYGTQGFFTGWGITANSATAAVTNRLKSVVLPIITNAQCGPAYPGRLHENMLCAGGVAGQAACRGDFGGALVVNGIQIGVASWGSCGLANQPNVFTRVASEVNWIRSVL